MTAALQPRHHVQTHLPETNEADLHRFTLIAGLKGPRHMSRDPRRTCRRPAPPLLRVARPFPLRESSGRPAAALAKAVRAAATGRATHRQPDGRAFDRAKAGGRAAPDAGPYRAMRNRRVLARAPVFRTRIARPESGCRRVASR